MKTIESEIEKVQMKRTHISVGDSSSPSASFVEQEKSQIETTPKGSLFLIFNN